MSNTLFPLYSVLNNIAPGCVKCGLSLAQLSYWKIGGEVDYFIEPDSIEQLAKINKFLKAEHNIPHIFIGDTSNLLFDDAGFKGVIVKVGNNLSRIKFDGERVFCEAGVWVPGLAYQTYRKGLSGIEHLCGIPGRIGGLIYMNGGSNRKSISDNLESVTLVDGAGNIDLIETKSLNFSYRSSPFQNDDRIIVSACLKLTTAKRHEVRNAMREILASRRKKFPRKMPNCGSVFVSDPKMYKTIGPPGFAIEKEGLKGVKKGNAQISTLHANFIVNLGGATCQDVLSLIHLARSKVYQSTRFKMDCEVRYVDPYGHICKAHLVSDKLN